jgi:hypothetical protein
MALVLQDFRDRIRETLDLQVADLPDGLVDEYVRDGSQFAQYARVDWPFYRMYWSFDTIAGDADYSYVELSAGDGQGFVIAQIEQIRGDGRRLRPQSADQYEKNNPIGNVATGEPEFYTMWGDRITFDPSPTAVETLEIRGIRKPIDWVTVQPGTGTDMPEEFDTVVLQWALGRAYAQQDEPETSVFYFDLASNRLDSLIKWEDRLLSQDHIVMGGGTRNTREPFPALWGEGPGF